MNNCKYTVDEVVYHFGGKYPESAVGCKFISLRIGSAGVFAPYYVTHERAEDTICTKDEFQQRARELGYGVEETESDSWYCYETQKALRLPPVGIEVETCNYEQLLYGAGESGEVLAHVENTAVIRMSYGLGCFCEDSLRPRDWNRKAEAERKRTLKAIRDFWDNKQILKLDDWFAAAYDAGFLRMPEGK